MLLRDQEMKPIPRKMDSAEIERKTEEVLRRDEKKIIKALELYYSNFRGDGTGMTFGSAAYLAKANPAYMVNYMFYRKDYTLGMPDDREDAQEYLKNLKRLKRDLRLQ